MVGEPGGASILLVGTGFGIAGQPFVGADIGGFQGNCDAELFLRWMQYGTLTPFCRNHSEIGNVDQYAWSWGEVIQDLVREAIRLRYRLMPYLYATFLRASETGAPSTTSPVSCQRDVCSRSSRLIASAPMNARPS